MQSYTGALEIAQLCGQLNMTQSGWKVDKQTKTKKAASLMRVLDFWQTSLSFHFTNTFWQKEGTNLHLLLTLICLSLSLCSWRQVTGPDRNCERGRSEYIFQWDFQPEIHQFTAVGCESWNTQDLVCLVCVWKYSCPRTVLGNSQGFMKYRGLVL